MRLIFLSAMAFGLLLVTESRAQQIAISRVEQMPNLPSPYIMRDWKQVARGYDSLVFDLNRAGQYLPLVWINNNTVNYPNHSSFGLHTVVGTPYPSSAEAINVLPAVIGATLVGIDKSNQNGYNWVLGCEEFFNRRPEENVYLNSPTDQSGDDWWYATMPNIFFYQLYDLYPGTGDFEHQFISVAEQWLKAVIAMGGSATPWEKPYMNYRGWYLSTMKPYISGVTEPEAAGAIAWLLYNAFIKTGEARYRIGAEWALEFLSDYPTNAAYELQLPYGVYTAARMNAELGTNYNIVKMLNWCFNPDDNVRQWGVTLGRWGNYDCYGLVGEAKYSGYAFVMNGFEMAGALVPMVRYDERFARAIGKWILNLANASRLFYTNYLPDDHQDGADWSHRYDPYSYIAHEALRQYAIGSGISPYATGDAIRGGWGATNFALYGSSHVGILGGIIDTTDVPGILKLDLRKTDYFQKKAYPSYLFYNPYNQTKTVAFDVGQSLVDIYDAISKSTIALRISGLTSIPIPADAAVIAVLVPSNGTVSYENDKMLVNGIVVDYHSGRAISNYPPRIKAIATDANTILFNQSVKIYCTAYDRDMDQLSYRWIIGSDTIASNNAQILWTAPPKESIYKVICIVSDGVNNPVCDSILLTVVASINHPPIIEKLSAAQRAIEPSDTTYISCRASDPDGDSLVYFWSAKNGTLGSGDTLVFWIAPDSAGYFYIVCYVIDKRGGEAIDSVGIVVREFTNHQIGDPVAYYPFSGNANDYSGRNNHGIVNGTTLVSDRFGKTNSAYYFNGTTAHVRVPNSPSLNFRDAITVSFWMNAAELYTTRESYPISHGNWENRWKVSIIPDKRIRWTVKTTSGIKDLDSQLRVALNTYYHVVCLYDGSNFEIFINGALDNHSTFSGSILTTNIDLMIGQVLPNVNQYNFKGIIDDVRIYDYALSVSDIRALYEETSAIHREQAQGLPRQFVLHQNFPNPFNLQTSICFQLPVAGNVKLEVYDLTGRLIRTLINDYLPAGDYTCTMDAQDIGSGIYFYRLLTKDFVSVKKCVKLN